MPSLRSALGWLALVAFAGLTLVGFRLVTDQLKDAPVEVAHARFLDFLAAESAQAQAYRTRYYQKFGRHSVASKHFEQVCAAMTVAAGRDGVDASRYSAPMSRACRSLARKYVPDALPD